MASIRCAHCKHIHSTIAEVKNCSNIAFERSDCTRCFRSLTKVNGMWLGFNGETYCPNGLDKHVPKVQAPVELVPTAEDIAFVRTAISTTQYPLSALRESLVHGISIAPDGSMFSVWLIAFDQIMLEMATAQEQEQAQEIPAALPATEPGMYQKPSGTIYRVKFNKLRTHLYAERVTQETYYGKPKLVFTYMPGEIKNLTADMRMTVDTAKIASQHFGACCVCGRTLTAKESIAAGIGPVCASRI